MNSSIEKTKKIILNIEKMASERFSDGDVSGYLDIYR